MTTPAGGGSVGQTGCCGVSQVRTFGPCGAAGGAGAADAPAGRATAVAAIEARATAVSERNMKRQPPGGFVWRTIRHEHHSEVSAAAGKCPWGWSRPPSTASFAALLERTREAQRAGL